MKLGANTVLFGGHDIETAYTNIQRAGYDGIEISAIGGMSEHLVIERWRECVPQIRDLAASTGLILNAMEQPSRDPQIMRQAMEAAVAAGIPIINCGPGGKADDEESLRELIASLREISKMAEDYGVIVCVKAHVGAAMYNTPTTLRVLEAAGDGLDAGRPRQRHRLAQLLDQRQPDVAEREPDKRYQHGRAGHHYRDLLDLGPVSRNLQRDDHGERSQCIE